MIVKAQIYELSSSKQFEGGGNAAKEVLSQFMLGNNAGGGSPINHGCVVENGPLSHQAPSPSASYEVDEKTPHNASMSNVSKDLLDARLETIEVRMDARMARIEDALTSIAKSQGEVLASNKSTRTTMVVTGISSVLAIVFGVGAFNATVLSNMVASFESGKNTASMLSNSEKAIVEATRALEIATEKATSASANQSKQR